MGARHACPLGTFGCSCRGHGRELGVRTLLLGWLGVCAACQFEHGNAPPRDGASDGPIDAPGIDMPAKAWWDTAYRYRRPIDIDTSKLTGAITDLPVLVTLTGPPMHMHIAGGGADLRFVSEDNNGTFA